MSPFYILIHNLGMLNTPFSLMLTNAVTVFSVYTAQTSFSQAISHELLESAIVDRCTNTRFCLQIVVPRTNIRCNWCSARLGVYCQPVALRNNRRGAVPLLITYPFIQEYFARGIMVGSIKG